VLALWPPSGHLQADARRERNTPSHLLKKEAIIARTTTRTNDQIRISPIRLIDADGEQLGIVPLDEAREKAAAANLDLVEVAPGARPPVVRLMDWGKYQYEQQKRAKEARKNQQTIEVKELKFRPKTDDHDLAFKVRNARRFLDKGKHVKVTVRFRRRELRRPELGQQVLDHVAGELDDVATVTSRDMRLEGRQLTMMLEPQG
jgi:translation initiation factor IF-3